MSAPAGKPLTPTQVEEIISRYDQGHTMLRIAKDLDYQYKTVTKYVNRELARRGKAFAKERDQFLGSLVTTLMRNVQELEHPALEAEADIRDYVALKAEQRQTIAQIAKLIGLDQPQKVEHSGTVEIRQIQWIEEVAGGPETA